MLTTSAADTFFGVSGGDDTFTATSSTFQTGDMLIDGSSSDSDTLTITATTDMTAETLTVGIETINVNVNALLSGGDTTFAFDGTDLRGAAVNFDVTADSSLISDLDLNGARSATYTLSSEFATANVGTNTDADVVLVVNNDVTIVVSTDGGAGDDLTITAGTNDVTLTSSTATEDLVISGAAVTATAASALGNVTVTGTGAVSSTTAAALGNITITAGGAATVSAAAALGNITVTAGGNTTVTTAVAEGAVTVSAAGTLSVDASAAEGDVTVDNVGGEAGDDITIDAAATTSLTVNSVGAITFGADADAVETMSLTAAENTTIDANGAAAGTDVTLNAVQTDDAQTGVVFTATAANITLNSLAFGGDMAVTLATELGELDDVTVTNSNTAGATLSFNAAVANADLSSVAASVELSFAADAAGRTITLADTGENVELAADQTGTVTFAAATTTNTTNSVSLTTTAARAINILSFTDYATVTLDSSDGAMTFGGATFSGDQLATVILTGDNAIDFGAAVISNTTTDAAAVVVNASAMTAAVDLDMDGGAGEAETFIGGSGIDTITITADSDSDDAYSVTTNAGADVVSVDLATGSANISTGDGNDTITVAAGGTVTIDAGAGNDSMELDGAVDFTFAGGSGVDTIIVDTTVDLTSSTFSWSAVEQLDIHGVADLTILASDISGQTIVLTESSDDGAEDLIISVDQVVVDLSGLGVASSWDAADDVTIDASGMGLSMTITGSAATDVITGTSRADAIDGGAGTDTIDGNGGVDTLTGGAAADVFVFNDGDSGVTVATADVITDFTTTADTIDLGGYLVASVATDYSEADGSGAADFAALVVLADAAFVNDVGDGVHVLYNALGTGNAYVFFDASGDNAFGSGDTLIIMTGVSTAAGVIAADFV